MPVYYFDIEDEHGAFQPDSVGQTLGDRKAARREAITSLLPMAADALPNAEGYAIKVTVRDDNRRAILFATLCLDTRWIA